MDAKDAKDLKNMDGDEETIVAGEPPVMRAVQPNNRQPVKQPEMRQPREGVTQYRVRTRGVTEFRRCGINFGPDDVLVDADSLTLAQKIELLNTPSLTVAEIGGSPPARTVVTAAKPPAAKPSK